MRHFIPATIAAAAIIGAIASTASQLPDQSATTSPTVQLAAMSSCDNTGWHATAQALATKLAGTTDPDAVRVQTILNRAGYPCTDSTTTDSDTTTTTDTPSPETTPDAGTITDAGTSTESGTTTGTGASTGTGTTSAGSGSSLDEANGQLSNIESKYGDLFSWGARASNPAGTAG